MAFRSIDMMRSKTNRLVLWSGLALVCVFSACAGPPTIPAPANVDTGRSVATAAPFPAISPSSPPIQRSPSNRPSVIPKDGFVPDEQTAIAIAVAVWIPIYGREQIESEKPYSATLKNGIWTVTGTLPEGMVGGTAEAEITRPDGRILRVIHYK